LKAEHLFDVAYRGVQWASLRLLGDKCVLMLYSAEDDFEIPVEDAVASIEEAERRLRQLG
jgi:hypothetical protein